MENRKRINWIDVAKGIGIFIIVLGHVLKTGFLRQLIFSFHVPFFFLLSGVTLNTNQKFLNFVKKKILHVDGSILYIQFI